MKAKIITSNSRALNRTQRQLTALAIMRAPNVFAWWGIPYDPYGRAEAYAHPYPLQFFDFPSKVKMGAEFWDFVGGNEGIYGELLALYRSVGLEYAARLEALRAAVAEFRA
jgi:hypothetical protein